jgi:hypothetical protein
LTQANTSSFTNTDTSSIQTLITNYAAFGSDYNDIWGVAEYTLFILWSQINSLTGTGLTYIISQDNGAKYYAQVCAAKYYFSGTDTVSSKNGPDGAWGSSLLLQMR